MEAWKDVLLEMGADQGFTPDQLKTWLVQQKASGSGGSGGSSASGSGGSSASGSGGTANPATLSLTPYARLPVFSGEKSDSLSFRQFKNEVQWLLREEREPAVMLAIRRALRGAAGEVLFHMGEETKVQDVLSKLEAVFGEVKSSEQLLEAFYSARQMPKETVAEWGCRLEDIVDQAKRKGSIDANSVNGMLRSKFWSGLLSPQVKMALRHLMTDEITYVELLSKARASEAEFASVPIQTRHQAAEDGIDKLTSKLDTVLCRLDSMEARLASLESSQSGKRRGVMCFSCGEQGHVARQCKTKGNEKGPAPWGGSQGPKPAPH